MKSPILLPKTTNGSLHLQWKRCGRKNCRCALGLLHGPYIAFYWRKAGRQHKRYIPIQNLKTALLELEHARAAWPNITVVVQTLKEFDHV